MKEALIPSLHSCVYNCKSLVVLVQCQIDSLADITFIRTTLRYLRLKSLVLMTS